MLTNEVTQEEFFFYVGNYASSQSTADNAVSLGYKDTREEGVVIKREYVHSATAEPVAYVDLCPNSEQNHRFYLVIHE